MPTPVVTREITITYGGFVVGGTSDYQLHGLLTQDGEYDSRQITFEVICQDASRAQFLVECTALEVAFKKKNTDLKVELGSDTWFDLTHAGNTGMNSRATCSKIGSLADSNLSRIYRVTVYVELPSDEAGKAGRTDSNYSITEDATGLKTLSVVAEYSALASNSALVQAQATFPNYCNTLKPVGLNWDEVASATYTPDDENKQCTCRAAYREIIFDQSAGASNNNDTTLVGAQIVVSTRRTSPSSFPGSGAEEMVTLLVSFTAGVIKSKSTDLKSVWENTARPYLITVAESLSGQTGLAVLTENPVLRPTDNRIHGTLVLLSAASQLVRATINIARTVIPSEFYVPVADGTPYSRDRHRGFGTDSVVVRGEVLEIGEGSESAFAFLSQEVIALIVRGYVVVKRTYPTNVKWQQGVPRIAGTTIVLHRRVRTVSLIRADVKGGSALSSDQDQLESSGRRK